MFIFTTNTLTLNNQHDVSGASIADAIVGDALKAAQVLSRNIADFQVGSAVFVVCYHRAYIEIVHVVAFPRDRVVRKGITVRCAR